MESFASEGGLSRIIHVQYIINKINCRSTFIKKILETLGVALAASLPHSLYLNTYTDAKGFVSSTVKSTHLSTLNAPRHNPS